MFRLQSSDIMMDLKQYTEQLAFQKFGVTNVAEPYTFVKTSVEVQPSINDELYLYVGTINFGIVYDSVLAGNYETTVNINIIQTSEYYQYSFVKYLNIEQGSESWLRIRLGKVTASRVADVMAKTKTGVSASRGNYLIELALQRVTGVNCAMLMGGGHPDIPKKYAKMCIAAKQERNNR